MLFADVSPVVQVDWQGMTVLGSTVGAAIVGAAKILAGQWAANNASIMRRHEENRQDAREAREENRALSQAILTIQGKTVETLAGLQGEIERVVSRLDRLDGGSRTHAPVEPCNPHRPH